MYRNYEDEGFTEKDIEEMMTPNMPEDEKEDLVESFIPDGFPKSEDV